MKKHISALCLALTCLGASAQTAPAAIIAKSPERMVRTVSSGDMPMLDDVSIVLLAGGTPEQALANRQASFWVDKGFWAMAATIGDASIRSFRKMGIAEVKQHAKLIQKTTRFFLPVALSTPYIDKAGVQAQFPITIDSERFNLQPNNASVCAYGRQFCLVLDNVNLSQTIHRTNPGRPVMALKQQTTLVSRSALPVYGLIVDVKPGVIKVGSRNVVIAGASRGGFIDLAQCTRSSACGVAFEFGLANGAAEAGYRQ